MGAFESGSEFLAGVIAKLPTELQAQARDLFGKPEAKDAVIVIGDGALARPDYSKAMNDLKAKEAATQARLDELNAWFNENQAALQTYVAIKDEYETLKAGKSTPPKDPAPATPPPDPRKVAEEVLGEQGPQYVQVAAWLAAQTAKHQRLFGLDDPFDPLELVANPKLGKPIAGQPGRVFSLQDAYNEKYGERVAAKQKEAEEKRFNDEVQKRLSVKLAESAGQPFPLRDASPSPLDVLSTEKGPSAHTLDTAVAEFERLQQARSSAT